MILVDSIYINNGGGKILLDYLVSKLSNRDDVYFLFDSRCTGEYDKIPENRRTYMVASLFRRHIFYLRTATLWASVLCFGNLAPSIKLNAPVYTYFHQPMFLNIPEIFNLKDRLLLSAKTKAFQLLLKNTNHLLVQSQNMKTLAREKFPGFKGSIDILPFYPNEDLGDERRHYKHHYIYVSGGAPHKNHARLIQGFCLFFDRYKKGKLTITVSKWGNPEAERSYEKAVSSGYPIENIGFVDRKRLIREYNEAEYLIFPSLEESFGLGLVEAIECGCKVIGADRPYTYQVCEPSLTFDPFNVHSIENALIASTLDSVKPTKQLIRNEVDVLLNRIIVEHSSTEPPTSNTLNG